MRKNIWLFAIGIILSGAMGLTFGGQVEAQESVPPPTFHAAIALDSAGQIIPGAEYEAVSCLSWTIITWMCSRLNDEPIFNFSQGLANEGVSDLTNLLYTEGSSWATKCSDEPLISVGHVIMIRQTAAPEGYKFSNGWNVFCRVNGNEWVSDNTQIQGVDQDGNPMPVASLANGVSVTYEMREHPDYPDTFYPVITFGGLFGGTAEAKIDTNPVTDPTTEPTTQPNPSDPTLAETGSNQFPAIFTMMTLLIVSLLIALRFGYGYILGKARK